MASVEAITFTDTKGSASVNVTISSEWNGVSISNVYTKDNFFAVTGSEQTWTVTLNSPASNGTGYFFVNFTNGATAVGKVTVNVPSAPDDGGGLPVPAEPDLPVPPDDPDAPDEPDVPDEPDDPATPIPAPTPTPDDEPDRTPGVLLPSPNPEDVIRSPENPDTAKVPVPELTDTYLDEAVRRAVEEAGVGNTTPTLDIEIKVPLKPGEDAKAVQEVKIGIPLENLLKIAEKQETEGRDIDLRIPVTVVDGNAERVADIGEVTLNGAALGAVIEQAGTADTVELVITKDQDKLEAEEKLDEVQKTTLKDMETRGVFDVSLLAGTTPITSFGGPGGGLLTIALPYEYKSGEKKEDIWVHRIKNESEGGGKGKMETGRRNPKLGKTEFQTDHLSVYAVAYEPAAADSSESGGGGGGGCDAGFGAGAGLFLAAAFFAARKSGRR
jgi:hypothetical protein